ncbi:prolipoprotein diacylglyceryl transferase [archaeon]|nr:prolipoprotein diacylglyceryl transferase [archaeon]
MFVHNINPVLFSIFGLEVRYYGIIYALGFLVALFWLQKNRKELNLTKENVYDFIFYLAVGVIVGSRLFEVFYNPSYFLSNFTNILKIWDGGMSFHGGLIGAILVSYFYSKKKGIRFYKLVDIMVIPAAFMLFLGRIANFINGELVGKITNVSWCVEFKDYENCRHPSQIYEAFKNLVILFVLLFTKTRKSLKEGSLFWLFVTLYGLFRFLIEFLKEPTITYFGIPLGQALSFIMLIIGGYMLWEKIR